MSEAQTQSEYAKVVTNEEEIVELTNLFRLHGTGTDGSTSALVKDAIINFEDGSVSVKVFDPMASVWAHVRGPFSDVRRDGKLNIGSIKEFRSYLGRFGEKTVVQVEDREDDFYLTFDDEQRKRGGHTLTDETHIQSIQDVEDLPFVFDPDEHDYPHVPGKGIELSAWFRCDVADIQDILNDGDTTDIRKYPITVDEGEVRVRVGDESGWIDTDFQAEEGEESASSIYGYGIDNVFSNLSGEVEVYLMDNGPMWVRQDAEEGNNSYQLDYMIAEDEVE